MDADGDTDAEGETDRLAEAEGETDGLTEDDPAAATSPMATAIAKASSAVCVHPAVTSVVPMML